MNPGTRIRSNPAAWRLALGVLLGVVAWRGGVMAWRTHQQGSARSVEAIPLFKQDMAPNRDGTRLVFCQDTETGVGIYFYDLTNGQRRLICEQHEAAWSWQRFTFLAWSPDERLFAVAFPADARQRKEHILLCDGNSGEIRATVVADPNLYELVWLSPSSFLYSTDYNRDLRLVVQNPEGTWAHKQVFERVTRTELKDLRAASGTAVTWRDGPELWKMDSQTGQPERVANLASVTRDELFHPTSPWDMGNWKVTWTNDQATFVFSLAAPQAAPSARAFWPGGVRNYTVRGHRLYLIGNREGEPEGLWQYDVATAEWRCLVSSWAGRVKYWAGVAPQAGVLTNALGQVRSYHVWRPTRLAAKMRCPIILGQERHTWFPYTQLAAKMGCYFAWVDRPAGYDPYRSTWTEDVLALQAVMARDPNVDTNRVYLYACSQETAYLGGLLAGQPGPWKGAILFGPNSVPEPASLGGKRLLLVAGKEDGNPVPRLTQYLDRATSAGVRVQLRFQPNSQHAPNSTRTERDRERRFADFLAGD